MSAHFSQTSVTVQQPLMDAAAGRPVTEVTLRFMIPPAPAPASKQAVVLFPQSSTTVKTSEKKAEHNPATEAATDSHKTPTIDSTPIVFIPPPTLHQPTPSSIPAKLAPSSAVSDSTATHEPATQTADELSQQPPSKPRNHDDTPLPAPTPSTASARPKRVIVPVSAPESFPGYTTHKNLVPHLATAYVLPYNLMMHF